MANDNFETYWDSKEIFTAAKSKITDEIIAEVRKPLGETDYMKFFQALECYCTLRNAQKHLSDKFFNS
jgi:hypothetical protein